MPIETLYSTDMAEWYNLMYCDEEKTQKQLKFLHKIFKKNKVRSVLDIACGTGRHTIGLKKLDYDTMGIDLEPAMLAQAKKNAQSEGLEINFKRQDMRSIKLDKKFDAAIIFYTAFAYLDSNDDVIKALQSIHKHLKKGGILIIDTMFGWPMLVEGTFDRRFSEKMEKGSRSYEFIDENSLDVIDNYLYTTQTHIRKVGTKALPILKDKKATKLRLYFPNELDLFFRLTGFRTMDFFGDIEGHKLSEKFHERLIVVARKF